jgi:glycosyltransferase involved in cell wall biosynthesis
MKIFIVTETLLTGGAELFTLRLCDALSRRGHTVTLFTLRPDLIDPRLTENFKSLDNKHVSLWKIKAAALLDRICQKINLPLSLTEILNSRFIKKRIELSTPDAIHSHLVTADLTIIRANKAARVRHISTIHGDYIQAIKKGDKAIGKHIQKAVKEIDSIVVISDEQTAVLTSYSTAFKKKIHKAYNGYPEPLLMPEPSTTSTFNFGMIARAIPEKGWEQAILAFLKIKAQNARLILFGEGAYLKKLRKKYSDSRIIFAGYSKDPLQAINQIQAGLLPSYYDAESLPTTIIEYLAMSKPVIASSVGEIPRMLETEANGLAGILIDSSQPGKMVDELYNAMNRLMLDTELYQQLTANCNNAFQKFSMDRCVDAYLSFYKPKPTLTCAVY